MIDGKGKGKKVVPFRPKKDKPINQVFGVKVPKNLTPIGVAYKLDLPFDGPYTLPEETDSVHILKKMDYWDKLKEECPAYYAWLQAFSIQPCKINRRGERIEPRVPGADSFLVTPINSKIESLSRRARSAKQRSKSKKDLKNIFEKDMLCDKWSGYGKDRYQEGYNGLRPPTVEQLCRAEGEDLVSLPFKNAMPRLKIHFGKHVDGRKSRAARFNKVNVKALFWKLKRYDVVNGHIDYIPVEKRKLPRSLVNGIRCEPYLETQIAIAAPAQRFFCNSGSHKKWLLWCEYLRAFWSGQINSEGLIKAGEMIYSKNKPLDCFIPSLFPKEPLNVGGEILDGVYEVIKEDVIGAVVNVETERKALMRMAERAMQRIKLKGERSASNKVDETKAVATSGDFVHSRDISYTFIARARENLPGLLGLLSPEQFDTSHANTDVKTLEASVQVVG